MEMKETQKFIGYRSDGEAFIAYFLLFIISVWIINFFSVMFKWYYVGFFWLVLYGYEVSREDQIVYEIEILENQIKMRFRKDQLAFFLRKRKGIVGEIDFSSQIFYKEHVSTGRFSTTLNQRLIFDNGKGEILEIEVSDMPELKEAYSAIEDILVERLLERGKKIVSESDQVLYFGESRLSRDLIYVGHYGYRWEQVAVKLLDNGLLVKDLNPVIEPKMVFFQSISNRKLYLELLKWKLT